jgi:hypothetical protein
MFNKFERLDRFDLEEAIIIFENAKELSVESLEYALGGLERLKWINKMRSSRYARRYARGILDTDWDHHDDCDLCRFKVMHCQAEPCPQHHCSTTGCMTNFCPFDEEDLRLTPMTDQVIYYILAYYEARKTKLHPKGFSDMLEYVELVREWDEVHVRRKLNIAELNHLQTITDSTLLNPSIYNPLNPSSSRRPYYATSRMEDILEQFATAIFNISEEVYEPNESLHLIPGFVDRYEWLTPGVPRFLRTIIALYYTDRLRASIYLRGSFTERDNWDRHMSVPITPGIVVHPFLTYMDDHFLVEMNPEETYTQMCIAIEDYNNSPVSDEYPIPY